MYMKIIEEWVAQQKHNFVVLKSNIYEIYDDHYRVDLYCEAEKSGEFSYAPPDIGKSYVLQVKDDVVKDKTVKSRKGGR
jgi:hypothetical protein